jgi:hypothetical protein
VRYTWSWAVSGRESSSSAVVVRVFISYAHDSPAHKEAVRSLWCFLRENGFDAQLDLPAAERRQDWPLWMLEQVRAADFVLIIASPAYKRRAEGGAAPDEGRGVQWEAALIREEFCVGRTAATARFVRYCAIGLPRWSLSSRP